MSHFVVLVIGNDYEGQLAPYVEQSDDPENDQHFIFKDMSNSEEEKKEYETKQVELVDYLGKTYSKYEDIFYKSKPGSWDKECILPEGAVLRTGSIKELYPTFEQYLSEYSGYRFNEKKQAYGYWHNPNAKWDWYQVGGRWTGYFKLKEGKYGLNGNPGLMTPEAKAGWADSVMLGDIDVEGMIAEARKTANETYDTLEGLLKGREYPVWKDILAKHGEEGINAAREEYHAHEVVKDFNAARFMVWGDFYDEYGHSREEYVQKSVKRVLVPFAVLKDGDWYEKGRMGWWATVSNEMEENEWNEQFQQLIAGLPADTLLTAVDCHI